VCERQGKPAGGKRESWEGKKGKSRAFIRIRTIETKVPCKRGDQDNLKGEGTVRRPSQKRRRGEKKEERKRANGRVGVLKGFHDGEGKEPQARARQGRKGGKEAVKEEEWKCPDQGEKKSTLY